MIETALAPCERCPHACTRAVATRGPVPARLLFLSGAPRFHEEQQGLAFASPAFGWLEETLAAAGLDPITVHFATLIGCQPPNQRPMRAEEIAICAPRLDRTITAVAPEVIVLCGPDVLAALLPGVSGGAAHGQIVTRGRRRYFILRHPYAALHNERYVEEVRADLERLSVLLRDGLPALESWPVDSFVAVDSTPQDATIARNSMQLGDRSAALPTTAPAPDGSAEPPQEAGAGATVFAHEHDTTGVPDRDEPSWQRGDGTGDAPDSDGPAQLSLF